MLRGGGTGPPRVPAGATYFFPLSQAGVVPHRVGVVSYLLSMMDPPPPAAQCPQKSRQLTGNPQGAAAVPKAFVSCSATASALAPVSQVLPGTQCLEDTAEVSQAALT